MSVPSPWQNVIHHFLWDLRKQDLAPKTICAYEHDLLRFIQWVIAINPAKQLHELTEIDIIEYRQSLISASLKATTINRRIGSIQRLCRWAVENTALKTNIAQSIKQINVVVKRCPSGLKPSEVQRLLQAAGQSKHGHAKRNYALLHLMLQTGLRVNEVAALTRNDVELAERSGTVYVRLGKGRKAREVPCSLSQ